MSDQAELVKQLAALDKAKLNPWEQKFQQSIKEQHEGGRVLSDKQLATINKIVQEKIGGGQPPF